MKNSTILAIFFIAALGFLFACNSSKTADQYLKDDNQRKAIIGEIAHHQPYMAEMMQEMMNSDSCKQMMAQGMMSDSKMNAMMMDNMMTMSKNDTAMSKMMMDKTMEMCDADATKCNMMMDAMKTHPNVMKSMNMNGMGNMKMMPKK